MKLPRFNVYIGKWDNTVVIKRNGAKELIIFTNTPKELRKYLVNLLPNDYIEYIETYNIPYQPHTSDWWLSLVKDGREVIDLFTRSKNVFGETPDGC